MFEFLWLILAILLTILIVQFVMVYWDPTPREQDKLQKTKFFPTRFRSVDTEGCCPYCTQAPTLCRCYDK